MCASLSLAAMPVRAAFEQSIQCLPNGATPPALTSFNPNRIGVLVDYDSTSRFVGMSMYWYSGSGGIGILANGYGMEFKSYQYNYDDAAATGKGPAYVSGPGGTFFCDLPGCYIDSDFLSTTNSAGEYAEPQVGFGLSPGAAGSIDVGNARTYMMWTRAVSGGGNKSLMKIRTYATKTVIPGVGTYGIFLCKDMPSFTPVKFQDGIYAPGCITGIAGGNPPAQHC